MMSGYRSLPYARARAGSVRRLEVIMGSVDAPVFVSYAREDEDLARAMKDRLGDAGIRCLMDTAAVVAGDDWRLRVRSMIDSAGAVVVVATSRSVASHEVTAEWAYGMGLGLPVIPVVYRSGLKLPAGLDSLDRLDFATVANRQWEKLASRIRLIREEGTVTTSLIRGVGVSQVFTSRHDMLANYSMKEILATARDGSDMLVVGRSLEAWAREFQRLQRAMQDKELNIRMGLVTPRLAPQDWLVPGDYAALDVAASLDKFANIVAPSPPSRGSFSLYHLPNSAIFSFTYFQDLEGPCGILELGANLAFEERLSFVVRQGDQGHPSLLRSLVSVYDGMMSGRDPVLTLAASEASNGE